MLHLFFVRCLFLILGALPFCSLPGHCASRSPLALHPDNPHYFVYRGKPILLIGSGEHYGAVLNLDFNYVKYLDALQATKLNLTRTFTGAYLEPAGAFNITSNTLAPAPGRFICPWPRSTTPGGPLQGNKFDLSQWDPAYFKRLKDFVRQAEKRQIIVEMNLFCPFYEDNQWELSPQNAANNINNVGNVPRTNVYTLDKHGGLLPIHEAMVRKIVAELAEFDNVYYEICNEPYFGGVTLEWQHRIADVIVQSDNKRKHLISQNIANGSSKIVNPHPAISIFNYHYAVPPTAVGLNYALNKVIGDNETGFRGTNDFPYRTEAWNFIIAGGGLFNHLDYSFAAGFEDGTFIYPASQPGGGNPAFRKQMMALRQFVEGFNFVKMKPDSLVIKRGVPVGMEARALVEPGVACAIYLSPSPLPKDDFSVRWNGKIEPQFSETYTFSTISNDGVRLHIDGKRIIDNWTTHSEREDSGTFELKAGHKHDIRLDYFQSGGGASVKLFWSSPSQPKEIIPETRLHLANLKGHGLQARYYVGQNFEYMRMSRVDPQVDFDWTSKSPFTHSNATISEPRTAELTVELPPGNYFSEWLNPITGAFEKKETFNHSVVTRVIVSPAFTEDIALRIVRTDPKPAAQAPKSVKPKPQPKPKPTASPGKNLPARPKAVPD